MSWSFNTAEHAPSTGFTRPPEGDRTYVIKKTNIYLNRDKTAPEGIKLTCEILESFTADGPNTLTGRTEEIELAIMHAGSPQRQEIANGDLSAIAICAGVPSFEGQFGADGQPVADMFAPALHDKPFKCTVVHTESEQKQDDGTVKKKTYHNFRAFRNMAGMDAVGTVVQTWQEQNAGSGAAPAQAAAPAGGQPAGWGGAPAGNQAAPAQQAAPATPPAGTAPAQAPAPTAAPSSAPATVAPPDAAPAAQPAQAAPAAGGAPAWGGTAPGNAAPSWGGTS